MVSLGVGELEKTSILLSTQGWLDTETHAYNLSTLGSQGGRIIGGQELETSLAQHGETPSLLKIQKLARHGSACP